ncbi:pyruvate, phosphate dikinase [Egibacter rhizosphaerae]|uniref:Pyruvate, phosphate dikinase n=1 Tax=Egibacter rhizosphaerae TaxID=1670831 RepID=A0A411YL00_9ACTN|nr:pyruvate, phosphate dikinase [Egibacter rhizosphaerae]
MFVPLAEATGETCGGKAGVLGVLLRAGLAVPDGFVVPFAVHDAAVRDLAPHTSHRHGLGTLRAAVESRPLPFAVVKALERALEGLGNQPVAVRSSAANEDTSEASAAGQYDSVLAVCGVADVAAAVRTCWASLHSPRATAYRTRFGEDGSGSEDPAIAVIVQRHLDAEVSGVMFTPAGQDEPTAIEASWGLGPSVAAGTVTPDTYHVHPDGTVTCVVADKPTRLDRVGTQLATRAVPRESRQRSTLDEATATTLATLGSNVAATLGAAQDIEWSIADNRLWLLQARPITAAPPAPPPSSAPSGPVTLSGTPASRGTATGTARTVQGPQDFGRIRPGDILICPYTDPAWTPLLRIAAGVVTEAGGALSHAAIVAREHQIPAVLGIPGATTITDGSVVTIDGTAGTVTTTHAGPTPPTR